MDPYRWMHQQELIYINCADSGCCWKDLLRAMDDEGRWRERIREIHAVSMS